jgi:hypothetical protein
VGSACRFVLSAFLIANAERQAALPLRPSGRFGSGDRARHLRGDVWLFIYNAHGVNSTLRRGQPIVLPSN